MSKPKISVPLIVDEDDPAPKQAPLKQNLPLKKLIPSLPPKLSAPNAPKQQTIVPKPTVTPTSISLGLPKKPQDPASLYQWKKTKSEPNITFSKTLQAKPLNQIPATTLLKTASSSPNLTTPKTPNSSPGIQTTQTTQKDTSTPPSATVESVSKRLIISQRQKENPVVKCIHHVKYDFSDTLLPDFLLSEDTAALFLSLRYHLLCPDYIVDRTRALGSRYRLQILLCLADTKDSDSALKQLNKFCLFNGLTLIVSWSNQEVGRYVETYKLYASKSAESIKAPATGNKFTQYTECLTTIRTVNNTDAMTLAKNFGCVKNIMKASNEQLLLCPGMGEKKAKQLHDAFRRPFVTSPSKVKRRKTAIQSFVSISDSDLTKKNKYETESVEDKEAVELAELNTIDFDLIDEESQTDKKEPTG